MRRFLIAATLWLAAYGQNPPSELLEQKTIARVREYASTIDGVLGFVAVDLTDGRVMSWNPHTAFPTASSIKVAIMGEMFRQAKAGKFHLTDAVTLQPSDSVAGSGHLQIALRKGPVTLTVQELIEAMIETSDNTATNRCIAMAGMPEVNRLLSTLGLPYTRLQRVMLDTEAARRNAENYSTPSDMAHLMQLIYEGKVVDPATSKEMIRILKRVDGDIGGAVPAGVEVAAKPGDLTGVRCEAGIVFHPKRPFAVAIMSTYLTAGENPVGRVAHTIYEYYDRVGRSNRFGNRLE